MRKILLGTAFAAMTLVWGGAAHAQNGPGCTTLSLAVGCWVYPQAVEQVPRILPDGSANGPSVAFQGAPNTGMWRTGAGVMEFVLGGSAVMDVGPTVEVKNTLQVDVALNLLGSFNLAGVLTAGGATLTGPVSATAGTFSGNLSAANAVVNALTTNGTTNLNGVVKIYPPCGGMTTGFASAGSTQCWNMESGQGETDFVSSPQGAAHSAFSFYTATYGGALEQSIGAPIMHLDYLGNETLTGILTAPSIATTPPTGASQISGSIQFNSTNLSGTPFQTYLGANATGTLVITNGGLTTAGTVTSGPLSATGQLGLSGSGGAFAVNNITGSTPLNGLYATSFGSGVSYVDISGTPAGDHQRCQLCLFSETQIDGQVQENPLLVNLTNDKGAKTDWVAGTTYTVGANVTNTASDGSNSVYRALTSGVSGSVGPTCLNGASCYDGAGATGVEWLYINNGNLDAKIGIFDVVHQTSTGGLTWGAAFDVISDAGAHHDLITDLELDLSTGGANAVLGTDNVYNLFMGKNGTSTGIAWVAMSGAGAAPYSHQFGIFMLGPYFASGAEIADNGSAAVGYYFNGLNVGASHSVASIVDSSTGGSSYIVNAPHTNATFQDLSASPISLSIGTGIPYFQLNTSYTAGQQVINPQTAAVGTAGVYQAANSGTSANIGSGPQGTGTSSGGPITWNYVGPGTTHNVAAVFDASVAFKGIDLKGVYQSSAEEIAGVSPVALSIGGTGLDSGIYSLASILIGSRDGVGIQDTSTHATSAIQLASTAPIGLDTSLGTWATAQIQGSSFQVSPGGNTRTNHIAGFAPLANSALTPCGTSPSFSGVATDVSGIILTGSSSITTCKLNFLSARAQAPACVAVFNGANLGAIYVSANDDNSVTFGFPSAVTSAYFDYYCGGL